MLRILGKSSSINVRKVLWACTELGLAFEQEDWGSGYADVQSTYFKALNPNAMVPVLLDGDFVLWESNSILRYLANCYGGQALYPLEAQARARVDQWLDWQAADLNRAWGYAFMGLVRQSPYHQDTAQIAASLAAWNGFMRVLEGQLIQTQAYVAGASLSLADVAVGLSVNRWLETPFDRPQLPAVTAYCDRLSDRIGFQRYGRNGLP
ncbi:glutathione S-transferase [Lampropedia puyangensis]|uniref:Glutathione S-transferase n=1 Tax=Lampropedia puyangensis TaxID=1330072 RepID=A0A4V4GR49_9BURK|nr:glutathione S-transferase [Lampropedia puyangensis]THT99285.1 glutathione S-transferase [Lampropedia puyangensis]